MRLCASFSCCLFVRLDLPVGCRIPVFWLFSQLVYFSLIQKFLQDSVCLCQGCCNKVPWVGWFKATETYFMALEAGSKSSGCHQGRAPPELVGRTFLALSGLQWLQQAWHSWLWPASPGSISIVTGPLSACPSLPLSYKETSHVGIRAPHVPVWPDHN